MTVSMLSGMPSDPSRIPFLVSAVFQEIHVNRQRVRSGYSSGPLISRLFPYGLDAPGVVRNLGIGAALCWIAFLLSWTPLPVQIDGLYWPATSFSLGFVVMVWNSRYGKLRSRDRLLDMLSWRGDEQVLDVGCGAGLLTVAAARRVPRGKAMGIDIWNGVDLSANHRETAIANARLDGVLARTVFETADMRAIPLEQECMHIVLSSMAVHNLPDEAGRAKAISEMARVLRIGGRLLIRDIRHLQRHESQLRALGFDTAIKRNMGDRVWAAASLGYFSPGTLTAWKIGAR